MTRPGRFQACIVWAAILVAGCAGCRSPQAEARPAAPPAPAATNAKTPRDIGVSIAYLNSQRAKHPKDPSLLVALGKAYVAAGRLQEGLAAFQDSAAIDPRHLPAYLGQAQLWLELGRPARAVEAYTRATKLAPDQPLIELELANAYLVLRDFPSAQKHAERAEKLDPSNPEVHRALGLIFSATGDITSTTRAGQKAIDLAPADPRNWMHMGSLYVSLRNHQEAARCYRKALELEPSSVDANVLLADTLNQVDQTPELRREVQSLLGRALTLDPYQPRALHLLGRLYLEDGEVDLAVPTLRRAVRWGPESQETLLTLGQALTRQGAAEEGRRILAQAQKALDATVDFRGLEYQAYTNPNPDVHLRLAQLYEKNRMHDSALYAVERGLKMERTEPRLLAFRARLLRSPSTASSH